MSNGEGYTVKEIVEEIRDDVKELRTRPTANPDHERRIRRLEKWMWAIPAGAAATVIVAVELLTRIPV